MSNIKKFFSKLKSDTKFAKAGKGHRLDEPIPIPRNEQFQVARPQIARQIMDDSGTAARAAADAAQQRLQQKMSWQQSSASSKMSRFTYY